MSISDKPKISIIIPVYNIEKYLSECIDSILNQTYSDFEIILVNDGSTDKSGAICDRYAGKYSNIKVYHKNNGGVSSARNFGVRKSKGEWVCYIDGDDWVHSTYLESLISNALSKNADIVFCDLNFATQEGNKIYQAYTWNKPGREDNIAGYITSCWTVGCGNIHKRSLYVSDEIRCPENISYCEDFYLMIRIVNNARKVCKVNEPLYFYRQHPDSVMHNLNKKTEADEQWVYLNAIDYFRKTGLYDKLERPLAWRVLKATQEMVLDTKRFDDFINIFPAKRDYILSCPYVNAKLKTMMWCLTHRLRIVTTVIVKIRKQLNR